MTGTQLRGDALDQCGVRNQLLRDRGDLLSKRTFADDDPYNRETLSSLAPWRATPGSPHGGPGEPVCRAQSEGLPHPETALREVHINVTDTRTTTTTTTASSASGGAVFVSPPPGLQIDFRDFARDSHFRPEITAVSRDHGALEGRPQVEADNREERTPPPPPPMSDRARINEKLKVLELALGTIRRQHRRARRMRLSELANEAAGRGQWRQTHRLARRLAERARGPKQRRYNVPRRTRATEEDWREFLALPPNQGGMGVKERGFGNDPQELVDVSCTDLPELANWSIDIDERAEEDMRSTRLCIRRAAIGKDSPFHSPPAEIHRAL